MNGKEISDKMYYAYPAISKSQLKHWDIEYPMRFWRHCDLNPKHTDIKISDVIALGLTAHCLLFEQKRLYEKFKVVKADGKKGKDEYFKKRTTNLYNDLTTKYPDTILINELELEKATKMIKALAKSELIKNYISYGQAEKPYIWVDKKHNIPCKCKIDWERAIEHPLKNGIMIIDYKTSSQPERYARDPFKYGWYLDFAMFKRMVLHKYGDVPFEFKLLVQSTVDGEEDNIQPCYLDHDSEIFASDLCEELIKTVAEKYNAWLKGDKTVWAKVIYEKEVAMPKYVYGIFN